MAGRKRRAPRSRTYLLSIRNKHARKGVTKEEMIAVLQKQHPEIIRAEMDDILHLGLMVIANSVCNLKSGSDSSLQIELFEGYEIPRTITLRVPDAQGVIQNVTKAVDSLTKGEARQYVMDHAVPRPKQSKHVRDMKRLLDDIGDHGEADWLLRRCLKVAKAASK